MLIALDYDDTYTRDPDFWLSFISFAEVHQYEVICVTMRTPAEVEMMCDKLKAKVKVYPTSRQAKKQFLEELRIFPNIWIDDNPLFINVSVEDLTKALEGKS